MERAAVSLGIKSRILEADIKDLAWVWEATIRDMDLHNPLSALDILDALVRAYIRGRNCRMGSYQTLWKHLPTKAAVMYQLARYVAKENAPGGYVLFPSLRDCAVTSVDEFLVLAKKLSMERSRRQEAEEMRRAEEARKTVQQKERDFIENLREGRQGKHDILDEIRRFVDGDERR